jgi:hypothetical protein
MKFKLIHIVFSTALIMSMIGSVNAQQSVNFAGLGFVQTSRAAKDNLVHASRFVTKSPISAPFIEKIYEKASSTTLKDGRKIEVGLASLANSETISLALTFESEEIVLNHLSENEYSVRYVLDAPIIAYDIVKQAVLASYPIRLASTTSFDHEPSAEEIELFVNQMYLGVEGDASESMLVKEFEKSLALLDIKQAHGFSIQVKEVSFSDNAKAYLAKNGISEDFYSQKMASIFSSLLSTELNVPVLPYIRGDALARKISLNFEETGLLSLDIPDATFNVNLGLMGFGTKLLQESALVKRYSFGVGLEVEYIDGGFNSVIARHSYQLGIPKNFTNIMELNETYWHNESLAALVHGVIGQYSAYDRKWAEEHISGEYSDREIKKDFEKIMNDVIGQLQ